MHLTELWCAFGTMTVISYLFRSSNPHVVALSLIGWVWPIFAIMKVSEDISGVDVFNRTKVIILSVGAFLTVVLASYGFSFSIYTTAFCLSVGIVGGLLLFEVYKKKSINFSILGNLSFIMLGLFFGERLFYPAWRMTDFYIYGIALQLLILIGLGSSTISFILEVMKDRNEQRCEMILKERNEQFLGQSKYSELGMMSAGIAHEINNPLAIIQAKTTQLLRIVRDPERVEDVTEGLEQILYTSERINRTIQGVREFVHQDERLPNEEFLVKHLVDDVLAFCGQRMKNHGVNLRFYGIQNYSLRGHKIQLEQVLLNLLNNSFDAIEYLPDKWIELSVHESEDAIQIFVKDSGSGIPPETASRMMEAFYTTKKVGKGTGLGLAMARGIVEQHGGSLVYVGNARHTTFMLELPKPGSIRSENIRRSISDENRPEYH